MMIIELPTTPSTNDYLKANCHILKDGTLVYTTNQTGGRGRRGRTWQDVGNGLAMSLLLKEAELSPALPLFIGLVARQALCQKAKNTKIFLKWPNDIICQNKKLGGILCESVVRDGIRHYICGIGINLAATGQDFIAAGLPDATSLFIESNTLFSAREIVDEFLNIFKKRYSLFCKQAFQPFIEEYNAHCLTTGRNVVIQGEKARFAFAKGVNKEGRLIVENENGAFLVDAGDVSIRGNGGYLY